MTSLYTTTIVYPPEPRWCGGAVTWTIPAASQAEAERELHRLTEGRWAADPRATPMREVATAAAKE